MRRKVTLLELRRAARRPWKRCAKNIPSTINAITPSTNTASASANHSVNSNSLNVTPNAAAAAAAAAALNLAGLGPLSSNSSQQAMAAILQQQMMAAQNLPLLANNHFGSPNSFLGMSPNSSGGSTSKLTR